ncbi:MULTISPECIES: chemotaxis protein CheW [Clostridium]|uniref:chemotaxis protein CheW n=1 Tax=Clostridium TaxID=1485 RepID=UPI000824458B|nr:MULTISPECIES: chemotaxis protein CheW [Clostridium]PJI07221.1 chemotaxis protein CheW [Clostridium sp. CT7]
MSEVVVDDLIEEEDTQKNKYLTFTLEKEFYGIEIKYVIEIIGIQPISEIPELPQYIKGIINLRGKIIPVMDIRLRFKKEPMEYNDRTCIIVIEIEDIYIGLIVDGVSEVIDIPDCEIVEPPEISRMKNKFIKGIGKVQNNVKLLLDCEKLLNHEDADSLSNA